MTDQEQALVKEIKSTVWNAVIAGQLVLAVVFGIALWVVFTTLRAEISGIENPRIEATGGNAVINQTLSPINRADEFVERMLIKKGKLDARGMPRPDQPAGRSASGP